LLAVEFPEDFAEPALDGVLPAVDLTEDPVVLMDDGRGFAEAALGLTGAATFAFEVVGLGAGRAFDEAVGAAGVQVLAFFGAPGPVIPLRPPVVVSLNPSGFDAVPTRDPGALVQSLMEFP